LKIKPEIFGVLNRILRDKETELLKLHKPANIPGKKMDEWHPYIDLCENFTSHAAIHLFVTASQFAVLGDSCCDNISYTEEGG
jgi:hypothetical protein